MSTTWPLYPNPGLLHFDLESITTPPAVPGAPGTPTATGGVAQAVVTWTAASSDWPNAVTGYTVTPYPDGTPVTVGNVLTATVTGLTNGEKYSFTVHATNVVGTGVESAQSNGVTPAGTPTAPGTPTSFTATPTGTTGFLSWATPASNGGSAITGYSITGLPGGTVTTAVVNGYTATGLTVGTTYPVTVAAINAIGTSSTASASLVVPATVPASPGSFTASSITTTGATLSWTAPSNGGSAITGYTLSRDGVSPSVTSPGITSVGAIHLTQGVSYTFFIVASNAVGDSLPASVTFTSLALPVPGAPFEILAVPGDGEATLTWISPGGTVSDYTITAYPGGDTLVAASSPATFPGLTNNVSYVFTVTANNVTGSGVESSPSTAVIPTAPIPAAINPAPTAASVDAYAQQLKQLFPPGALWNFEAGSWLSKTTLALATEFARVSARAIDLLNEWDPRTAIETLPEWETMLGLPDVCTTTIPTSVAARRNAITSKYIARGGQTKQFYIDLAASLGYTVTIDTFKVCRSGRARSGDRCYGSDWAYSWVVNVTGYGPGAVALCGSARSGDRLRGFGQFPLECAIQRAAPAHTTVLFSYT